MEGHTHQDVALYFLAAFNRSLVRAKNVKIVDLYLYLSFLFRKNQIVCLTHTPGAIFFSRLFLSPARLLCLKN